LPNFQPDIALLDLMPEIDGFMILQGMQKRWPQIKVLDFVVERYPRGK